MAEIKEAIAQINPDLEIRAFTDLRLFLTWIKEVVNKAKAPPVVAPAATDATATNPKTPSENEKAASTTVATGPTAGSAPEVPAAAPDSKKASAETSIENKPLETPVVTTNSAPAAIEKNNKESDATAKSDEASKSEPAATPEVQDDGVTPPTLPSTSIEDLSVDLLICSAELLKENEFQLLQKTLQFFTSKKLCTIEKPTAFVLTAFDNDHFDFTKFENQIVANVIFKPFDKLILREHIRIALLGITADTAGEVYKQKTKSKIEMLKDVHLESISELGFSTIADGEIKPGAQSKYYGKIFQAGTLPFVHAKVVSSVPIADRPKQFKCEFAFTNIQNNQISAIRKLVKSDKNHKADIIKVVKEVPKYIYSILVISPRGAPSPRSSLENVFSNITFTEYPDFTSFATDLDPGAKSLGGDEKNKDKFLPFPAQGKILFDSKMIKIVGFEPGAADTANILGIPVKQAMQTDSFLHQRIYNDDRNKWINLCKTQMKPQEAADIYRFKGPDDNLAFIKVLSLQPLKHEKLGDVLALDIIECTEGEKIAFLLKLSRLPATIDALFVDSAFLGEAYATRWQVITTLVNERNKKANSPPTKLFFVSDKIISSDEVLELQAPIDDIFMKPLDGGYFIKKMRMIFDKLLLKDQDMEISSTIDHTLIKVAQPVIAEEVAETGMAIIYHRAIGLGNFRKVCLTLPHEIGLPEFLGSCSAVEEIELETKKKAYLCRFVFFGVRDASLKHIRRWIKDYYVSTKEVEGG